MKILELSLWGCKRLMLKQIDHITMYFTSNQQIIIGTNGAGKSTVMRQCSPLPPEARDFTKNGGKIIKLEDKGSIFRLETDFSKAPHAHKFFKDNKNLNDSGISTIQKELVKQHFGLTQDLFDILVGDELFTSMAALKRRDWILKFSGSDLEYAMKVYKQLKGKHRDAQAMSRHYAKRLAEEQVGILTEDDIDQIGNKINVYNDELEALYRNRINNVESVETLKEKINQVGLRINRRQEDLLSKSIVMPNCMPKHVYDLKELDKSITRLQSQLINKENRLKELYNSANSFRDVIDALEANSNGDLDKLVEQIQIDKGTIVSINAILNNDNFKVFTIPEIDLNVYKGIFDSVYPELVDILTDLPENIDGTFTKEKKEVNEKSIETLGKNIRVMLNRVNELEHLIKHIKGIDLINCPRCDHSFQPGVNIDDLPKYESEIISIQTNRISAEAKLKELEEYSYKLNDYIEKVNRYRRLVKNNPELYSLWDCIFNLEHFIKKPSVIFPLLNKHIEVIDIWIKLRQTETSIANAQSLHDQVKRVSDQHGFVNANQLKDINTSIETTLVEINQTTFNLRELIVFNEKMGEIIDGNSKNEEDVQLYKTLLEQAIIAARNQCIDYDISIRNAELANLTKQINEAKTAKSLVKEIEGQLTRSEKELAVYTTLVNEISPTNGLIAKYIKDFIDTFITQMNSIIGDIWTYDFKILSCGIEDNDVTCKFPLSILNGTIQTPDVSKASSSQVDIVNFAFKIIVMYYLKLNDFPVYLDELAPSLDEKHRENILRFVDDFVTGKQCSQMFMISHYVAQHSIFENAEICVLADDNLTSMPDSYNHHVIINHDSGNMDKAA